jgi:hypothetical protein
MQNFELVGAVGRRLPKLLSRSALAAGRWTQNAPSLGKLPLSVCRRVLDEFPAIPKAALCHANKFSPRGIGQASTLPSALGIVKQNSWRSAKVASRARPDLSCCIL